MFELTFLGTSGSVPSPERNHPSLLVKAGGTRVLIDCGEGTQRQLMRSGLGLRRPDLLLLTHGHPDHVLGIPGLLSTLGLQREGGGIAVHGGRDTIGIVTRMLAALWGEGAAPVPLHLSILEPGRIAEGRDFGLDCFPVQHRGTDSFGFVFTEPAHRPMRPERLEALGVPNGPLRKELAAGRAITLSDGRRVAPADVLGPERPGTRLAVIGDAATTEGLAPAIRGADALVVEATFLARDADKARSHGHLTAVEAAGLAREAGVGRLILNHISGRYGTGEILAEAREVFAETVVAEDLARFTV